MPKELLPTVITAMCSRLLDRHSNKNEHYALLVSFLILNPLFRNQIVSCTLHGHTQQVNVLSCLEAAFAKVPPSSDVFGVLIDGCAG